MWTLRGPVTYYVLFFLHVHTRRVHVAGMTPNPDGPWMAQQARNMSLFFAEQPDEYKPTHIIRDRDSKFTEQFCAILESDGIEFRPIPPRSPNMNPFCERWVARTRQEVLNHFIIFGEKHLRHILGEWLTHYHTHRPHQGLGNVPIGASLSPREPLESYRVEDVVCHESLGGLLMHSERTAAQASWAATRSDGDRHTLARRNHSIATRPFRSSVASPGSLSYRNCLAVRRFGGGLFSRPVANGFDPRRSILATAWTWKLPPTVSASR